MSGEQGTGAAGHTGRSPISRITVPPLCSSAQVPGRIEVTNVAVLIREHGRLAGPLDCKSRVVPADASFTFWCVELVDKIERLCIVGKGEKAVSEALGYVHHPAVFSRELGTKALAKSGRALSQIEDCVVERSADAANNLGLGFGGELIVHATQCALRGAERVIDLDESSDKALVAKLPFAKGPGKEPSLVAALLQVDQVCPLERRLGEDHEFSHMQVN